MKSIVIATCASSLFAAWAATADDLPVRSTAAIPCAPAGGFPVSKARWSSALAGSSGPTGWPSLSNDPTRSRR